MSRLSTIVTIEEISVPDAAQHSHLVERLACGHLGIDHGATWRGTAAPLAQHAHQFTWLIGKARRCRQCAQARRHRGKNGESPTAPPRGSASAVR